MPSVNGQDNSILGSFQISVFSDLLHEVRAVAISLAGGQSVYFEVPPHVEEASSMSTSVPRLTTPSQLA